MICLPYAGGTAAVYRTWHDHFPESVEVLPVQLPGRGGRLDERPVSDLRALAGELVPVLLDTASMPVAIFGHSMGAWLALEVARRMEAAGRQPLCVFVSGRQAPSVGCLETPLGDLDDASFIDEMQARYDAIPAQILAHEELMALLLPALRADIQALERYVHESDVKLESPIVATVGRSDEVVPVETMAPWSAETSGPFEVVTLAGGHFYFQDDPRPLVDLVNDRINRAIVGKMQGV